MWVLLLPVAVPLLAGGSGQRRHVRRHVEALLVREEALDLLQALALGLRDEEQREDDGGEADPGGQPERAVAAHGRRVHHGRERLDDEEHLQVGQADGEAAEDGAHLAGEELGGVEEGHGAQAQRVGQGVEGDAEQGEPVGVAHEGVEVAGRRVLVRVDGQAQDDQGAAHHARGAAEERPPAQVPHRRDVQKGAAQFDQAWNT